MSTPHHRPPRAGRSTRRTAVGVTLARLAAGVALLGVAACAGNEDARTGLPPTSPATTSSPSATPSTAAPTTGSGTAARLQEAVDGLNVEGMFRTQLLTGAAPQVSPCPGGAALALPAAPATAHFGTPGDELDVVAVAFADASAATQAVAPVTRSALACSGSTQEAGVAVEVVRAGAGADAAAATVLVRVQGSSGPLLERRTLLVVGPVVAEVRTDGGSAAEARAREDARLPAVVAAVAQATG